MLKEKGKHQARYKAFSLTKATCLHDVVTCIHDVVTRLHDVVTCLHDDVVTCLHDALVAQPNNTRFDLRLTL